MSNTLEFETQTLVDSFADDALFIYARGLGIERLFLHHLRLYSDPKVLVLVVNTRSQDQDYFLEQLKEENDIQADPIVITNEISATDRQSVYLKGGVQFVTTRILAVDFLMNRVPAHLISGILIYRAETILESFQESFILRMYREKQDKGGFVKAFSDCPTFFGLSGLGQLQRLVSKLFVRRVIFVPRFEIAVKKCLEKEQPEVVEMGVELSSNMKIIQTSMMEIISACYKELKQCNPGIEMEDIEEEAVDLVGCASQGTVLEFKLEEQGYLSEKSSRLLRELKALRILLQEMEQLDPVSFYQSLEILRSSEKAVVSNSGWIFTSTAQRMFTTAENRIWKKDKGTKKVKGCENFDPEPPPKWKCLETVLKEIWDTYSDLKERQRKEDIRNTESTVLIVGANSSCCRQLADIIRYGQSKFLTILTKKLSETSGVEKKKQNEGDEEWKIVVDLPEEGEMNEECWWPVEKIGFIGQKMELEKIDVKRLNKKEKKKKGKRKNSDDSEGQLTLTQFCSSNLSLKKRKFLETCQEEKIEVGCYVLGVTKVWCLTFMFKTNVLN